MLKSQFQMAKLNRKLCLILSAIMIQVMNVRWDGHLRVHGYVLHLDIKDGKVWVQHNMTEMPIAQNLMALGVAKEDILLGFQAMYMREYTDFSIA
jgi:XisI protein